MGGVSGAAVFGGGPAEGVADGLGRVDVDGELSDIGKGVEIPWCELLRDIGPEMANVHERVREWFPNAHRWQ